MKIMLLSILLLISLTSCTAEQTPELLSDDIELPPQTTEVTEATETAERAETSAVMSEITEAPAEPTPVEIPDGEYAHLVEQLRSFFANGFEIFYICFFVYFFL